MPERAASVETGNKIIPAIHHGMRVISIGFFVERGGAVIWRGPMVHKLLQQFLEDVDWGELDYLIVDLPPGTGDAQLSLSQLMPITGAVMVTTPQEVSIIDVEKALAMWQRVEVPVLGLVENMSGYVCPSCGHHDEIFLRGGGRRLAARAGIPFLGEIPLQPAVSRAGDEGTPIVVREPDSKVAEIFARHRVGRRLRPVGAQRPAPGRRQAQLQAGADSLDLGYRPPAAVVRMGLSFRRLACASFACLALAGLRAAARREAARCRADAFPWEDAAPPQRRGRRTPTPGRRRRWPGATPAPAATRTATRRLPVQRRRPPRHAVLRVELPRRCFDAQTAWIVAEHAAGNIAFVLHEGDIVDDDVAAQWMRASHSLHVLDGVVPYVLSAGNHDYCCGGWPSDRSSTMINGYFPVATFQTQPVVQGDLRARTTSRTAHTCSTSPAARASGWSSRWNSGPATRCWPGPTGSRSNTRTRRRWS